MEPIDYSDITDDMEVTDVPEHTESTDAGGTGGDGGEGVAEAPEGVTEVEALPEAEGEGRDTGVGVPIQGETSPETVPVVEEEVSPTTINPDGVVIYTGDEYIGPEPIEIVPEHENPYGVAPCYDMVIVGDEGECGWIPGYEEEEIGEAITEQAQVGTTNPPTLAETGGVDMVSGAVLGLVLLTAGASAFIISKIKNRLAAETNGE